jgi:hypothetical protein
MEAPPTVPTDLRPAQLGMLLAGKPLVSHVAATVLDVAIGARPELDFEADLAGLDGEDARLPDALEDFRRHLVGSCVHAGLFHRLHHDRRTESGEQRLAEAHALRASLRVLRVDLQSIELLPWAVATGVMPTTAPVCGEPALSIAAAALRLPAWQRSDPEPAVHYHPQQPDLQMGVWTLSAGFQL